MADIHINEVNTELEITGSVGTLSSADVKKLVGMVMAQIKAEQHNAELRRRDDRLHESAYVSDLKG
jgi:hypothetical protein